MGGPAGSHIFVVSLRPVVVSCSCSSNPRHNLAAFEATSDYFQPHDVPFFFAGLHGSLSLMRGSSYW